MGIRFVPKCVGNGNSSGDEGFHDCMAVGVQWVHVKMSILYSLHNM